MESILISIKKMLGISEDYDAFASVIVMYINSVFSTLTQLGIGSSEGFSVLDEAETWSDFIGDDATLEAVKSYTYLRVRLLFDPPLNSTVIESMNRQINELEWRLNALADNSSSGGSDSDEKTCISIIKSEINSNGELILTYSDNTVVNLGVVVGAKGDPGKDGKSITSTEINANGELVLTYSDGSTANVGAVVGAKGDKGDTGATGADGQDGKNYQVEIIESTETTLELQPNKFYKFGEVTELNLTLAEITDNTQLNEFMFEFVSGETATTVTLPDTIKWAETPDVVSNKIYQCSIVNNIGLIVGVDNV